MTGVQTCALPIYSDLDLLVIRPLEVEEDSSPWENQLSSLARSATASTGNDAQIIELGEGELDQAKPLLKEVLEEGIELSGSLSALRDAIGSDSG